MIKYYLFYPPVYKILSSTSFTRSLYRSAANYFGDRRRRNKGLHKNNVEQGRLLVSLMEKYCNLGNAQDVLELGTGWIHFYSTYIRLFHAFKLTLFDIVDNRQIQAFKYFFSQLPSFLQEEEKDRIMSNKDFYQKVTQIESFDELYKILGAKYILDKSGNLTVFQDNSFDVVFSCVVLEHIDKKNAENYIQNIQRILKPGGYSFHIIDMGDHYHFMDKKNTHKKEYLKFSNILWKIYFENRLHYINRLQESDWHVLFNNAGFELIYRNPLLIKIGNMKIANDFKRYDKETLECHKVYLIHKKALS